ncbi:hypothetical protein GAR06_02174 [Micromonospora saelicesensis]|nr:hypothetical protein GAR06_02174 [Micromonospora saelicesensis]
MDWGEGWRTSVPVRRERRLGGHRDLGDVAAVRWAGTADAGAPGPVGCVRCVRRPPGPARRRQPVWPSAPGHQLRLVDAVRRDHRCVVTHSAVRGGRAATAFGARGQVGATHARCAAGGTTTRRVGGTTTRRVGGTTTRRVGGTTTRRVGGERGVLSDGLRRSGHRGPPVRTVLVKPFREAGPAGGVLAPLCRLGGGWIEVQVVQQAGRVGGDQVQPVPRRLPETAWCRLGCLRRLRKVAGGLNPPGEALHRPGRRAQPAGQPATRASARWHRRSPAPGPRSAGSARRWRSRG